MDQELGSGTEFATYISRRHQELLSIRSKWEPLWDEVAAYTMPLGKDVIGQANIPAETPEVFDSSAVDSNRVLANGMLTWMTPADQRWFAFDAPDMLQGNDEAKGWYKMCSEIFALILARSNFYNTIHEGYYDEGSFGLFPLWAEIGRKGTLICRKFDIGTYCIAEDDEGEVDTLTREFEITARQAYQWFGDKCSDKIKSCAVNDDLKKRKPEEMFCFVHIVFPRLDDQIEFGKKDGQNMPWASVYMEKKMKNIVSISGYMEKPFFVSRWSKWRSSDAYAWSPAMAALPDIRQLNVLVKLMDTLADVTTNPRMLFPTLYKEREVDLGPNGVTYFDENNPNAVPREWLTQGKYDIGLERCQEKRQQIQRAFHTDMFQMFANLDQKEMTAREVIERASEKMNIFSPAFTRKTTEFFNPFLVWGFRTGMRMGWFPPPPDGVIVQDANGAGMEDPKVSYTSRIALAVKALENAAYSQSLELHAPVMQVRPDIADNMDWDTSFRDTVRNAGLPERWLNPLQLINEIRKQRQQIAQQAQQQQQLSQMAESAGKLGSIKNDSALAGMLNGSRNA